MLTGTAAASSCDGVVDDHIDLRGADFDPEDACIDLGEVGGSVRVTFENHDSVEHNVAVHEEGNTSNLVRSSALLSTEKYELEFVDNGDGTFTASETDAHGNAGELQSVTNVSYNGHELHMHCDFHNAGTSDEDPAEMDGTINVVEP